MLLTHDPHIEQVAKEFIRHQQPISELFDQDIQTDTFSALELVKKVHQFNEGYILNLFRAMPESLLNNSLFMYMSSNELGYIPINIENSPLKNDTLFLQSTRNLAPSPFLATEESHVLHPAIAIIQSGSVLQSDLVDLVSPTLSNDDKNNAALMLQLLKSHEDFYRFCAIELKSSFVFNQKAVETNPWVYQYLPADHKDSKEIALPSIHADSAVFSSLDNSFTSDPEFIMAQLKAYPESLDTFSDEVKSNKDFVKVAVTAFGDAIEYADDTLKNDIELAEIAIKNGVEAYKYLPAELRDNYQLLMSAIIHCNDAASPSDLLQYASERLRSNKAFIERLLRSKHINRVEFVCDSLKDNLDFMTKAIKSTPLNYEYCSERLKERMDLAMYAIEMEGDNYCLVSDNLKDEPALFILAADKLGSAALHADIDILAEDVIQNTPLSILNDEATMLKAVEYCPVLLTHMPIDSISKHIALRAITKGLSPQRLPEAFRSDKYFIRYLIDQSSENKLGVGIEYASSELKNDKDLLQYSISKLGINQLVLANPKGKRKR